MTKSNMFSNPNPGRRQVVLSISSANTKYKSHISPSYTSLYKMLLLRTHPTRIIGSKYSWTHKTDDPTWGFQMDRQCWSFVEEHKNSGLGKRGMKDSWRRSVLKTRHHTTGLFSDSYLQPDSSVGDCKQCGWARSSDKIRSVPKVFRR